MTILRDIEERLDQLEAEVAAIRAALVKQWRYGVFADREIRPEASTNEVR